MQVPNPPGSGKDIAEGKGVHREVESEGSWMEGKKRVAPKPWHGLEVCAVCSEKSNRYCEITLNAQKSAEAIVAEFISEGPNQ